MGIKTLRNVVFWAFVLLYLVIAPVISLHALGFVFEPKTMTFVKTGIISLGSEPKDADVLLNGNLFARKTPVAITGLLPGRYQVEVRASSYQTWRYGLLVQAEEVTRVEHILLVPEKLTISSPVSFPVRSVVPSNEEKFLFLVSQDSTGILTRAVDLKRKRLFPVATHKETPENKTLSLELVSSPDDRRLLICFKEREGSDYFVVTLSEQSGAEDLSKILGEPISNVRFHPRTSKELFYLSAGELCQLNLEEGTRKIGILKGIRSFEMIEDKIYYFTNDFQLFSSNLEGKESVNLLPDRGLRHLLFGEEAGSAYQMFMTAKGNAFWLRQDGMLLMNQLPYFADEGVKGARLLVDAEKLLYWKSRELWLLDLSAQGERKQSLFEKGPSKTLLWRSERPIVSAQPMREGNHAIVATDRAIVLVDAKTPVLGNDFVICRHSLEEKISFYLDDGSGELYWIDLGSDGETVLNQAKLFEHSPFSFSFSFRKPYNAPMEISL